jgi:acetyltransferase
LNIEKLLKPKTIAIVGASEKMGLGFGVCNNVLSYQKDLSGVFFVHPKYDSVFSRKCYYSLSEVPMDIDLVIICSGRDTVISILEQAKSKNCKAAAVYASGYKEIPDEEGNKYEEELINKAVEMDIALMGPNCGGFVNFCDDIFAFAFEGSYDEKLGNIGLISQSGQFCIDMMNTKELKFSYVLSVGNCAITKMEDYLEFLVCDSRTSVIAIYIEGVNDPEKFISVLADAAIRQKPVIILKGGRSPQGAKNASTHTGSLAGDDEIYDAAFKKFGIIRALDLQDLRSTAMMFSVLKHIPERAKFGALCMSGGETGICADMGYLYNINYPEISPDTVATLKGMLPFYSTPRNPLDLTVTLSYDADVFAKGIAAFVNDPAIDIGILGYTITDKKPTEPEYIMKEGIKKAQALVGTKPLIIVPFVESTRYAEFAEDFLRAGIPILSAPQYAFLALRHLADFIEYNPLSHTLQAAILPKWQNTKIKRCVLSEYESRKYLSSELPNIYIGKIANTEDEAVVFANEEGYPLVMKVDSPDILHKTEAKCVITGIMNEKRAVPAYDEILNNAKKYNANAIINGVLIQKHFSKCIEMILGIIRDPQFGLTLMVGMGGIFVDIYKDTVLCPLPISKDEAVEMLMSLKAGKLLTGFRGMPKRDIDALSSFMERISDFAVLHKEEIIEMDLNPIFVFDEGKGIEVGDALFVLNSEEREQG